MAASAICALSLSTTPVASLAAAALTGLAVAAAAATTPPADFNSDRRVTIEEIQKRVAEHYSIRLADMHSPRRARLVARPRQVAMYLAKQLTSRSLPEIGRKFGGRDHTTVMHADRKIRNLMAERRSIYNQVTELTNRIKNG